MQRHRAMPPPVSQTQARALDGTLRRVVALSQLDPVRRNPHRGLAGSPPITVLPQRTVARTVHPLARYPDIANAIPVEVPWLPNQHYGRRRRRRDLLGGSLRHRRMREIDCSTSFQ